MVEETTTPRISLKLIHPETGDSVVLYRDELDKPRSFRAFDRLVRIVSESAEVDDKRIDLQIQQNGWSQILFNTHFGKVDFPAEQVDDSND